MSEQTQRTTIVRLVLDVLKPHNPNIIDFSRSIAQIRGIRRVDASVIEVDVETETIKLIIEGSELDVSKIEEVIKKLGAAIHSIDAVVIEKSDVKK
ncbi:MAG: DUF211 domain-containing protein [Nitrososphaerota archaeon]